MAEFDEDNVRACTNAMAGDIDKLPNSQSTPYPQYMNGIDPMSRANGALLTNFLCTGFIVALVLGLLQRVLLGTMAVGSATFLAYHGAVVSPWGFKCVFGFVSDHFQIRLYSGWPAYRRKWYAFAGNLACTAVALVLVFLYTEPLPFHCFRVEVDVEPDICNVDAADSALELVLLLMLAMGGVAVADAAAGGMMIQASALNRGRMSHTYVAMTCLIYRSVGAAFAAALVVLAYDWQAPDGTAEHNSSWQTTLLLVSVAVAACLASFAWFCYSDADEADVANGSCCTSAGHDIRTLLQQFGDPRFCRFIVFNLVCPALVNMQNPVIPMAREYWAGVRDSQQDVALATHVLLIATMFAIRRWCSHHDMRAWVAGSTVLCVSIGLPISLFTIFGVCRNRYLFMLQDVLTVFPSATIYLLAITATAAYASRPDQPKGHEATLYGIVTTAHALAVPLARPLAYWLYEMIPPVMGDHQRGAFSDETNYQHDTEDFRLAAALCVSASSGFLVLSQLLLLSVPAINQRHYKPCNGPLNSQPWAVGTLCVINSNSLFGGHHTEHDHPVTRHQLPRMARWEWVWLIRRVLHQ